MSLFAELKRRNVFKVGIAYAVSTWVLLQLTDIVAEILVLPEWAPKLILLILIVGFIPALIFAWAFELTPEGVKREKDVDRGQSITPRTGQKLNVAIGALLFVAVAYIAYDKLVIDATDKVEPVTSADIKANEALTAQPTPVETTTADIQKSIVVLPFINMSNDPEQEFFSDGLSEELLNVLAQIKELRVISRTSAFAFKGKDVDIPTIAAQLGVSHVLEGSVRKAGNDVRITAQLIEVTTDSHLWSDAYSRKLENVFEIQEEISKAIAQALQVTLGTGSTGLAAKPTENLEAYQLFLRGRHLYQNRGLGVERAIELLQKAVELDPGFANAWANLAAATAVRAYAADEGFQDLYALAEQSAQKAIELDSGNGLAHAVRGLLMTASLQWQQAIEELDLAIELNPSESNSLLWMGITLSELGYTGKAIRFLKRAETVDPVFTNVQNWLSILYLLTGEADKVRLHQQKALELDPGFETRNPGEYELLKGDIDLAESIELASLSEETQGSRVIIEATFAALRDPSKTDWAISTVLANKTQASSADFFSRLYRLGATEKLMENWHELRANGRGLRSVNFLNSLWYAYDRKQLSNPELIRLFNDAGMVDYWHQSGNPDYCRIDGENIECGDP